MFKPYEQYKPSGVEWLGDVPEHWKVKRGRFCMRVNPSSERLRELGPEDEVSFVPMEAVGEYGGLNLEITKQLGDVGSSYTEFQNGDVVVAKITPCFENGKGALAEGLRNGAALGTTELHVLRVLPALDRRFLFYLTVSSVYRKTGEAEMYGAGGQKRVPPEFNKDFRTPLPPSVEQVSIADFLDRETAKIDTLVAKKRTLIERLKEKRTALISRTVTRGLPPDAARTVGLDPHPKLKPSGIEWLGDVPEGWELKQLFRIVTTMQTGPFGSQLHQTDYIEGGVPLINPSHLVDDSIVSDDKETVTDETAKRLTRHKLMPGDVVFARRGEIGRCAVVGKKESGWLCGTGSMVVRLRDCDVRYFVRVFRSTGFRMLLMMNAVGTTMLNLNPSIVGRMRVPLPPLPEQCAIADYLDQETGKIDQMIAKVKAAIERLQEYRIALITAAVTGKIDVRGTAT